jgi:hypothetical protein
MQSKNDKLSFSWKGQIVIGVVTKFVQKSYHMTSLDNLPLLKPWNLCSYFMSW